MPPSDIQQVRLGCTNPDKKLKQCYDKVQEWDTDCRDRGAVVCVVICVCAGKPACVACVAGYLVSCRMQKRGTNWYCREKYWWCLGVVKDEPGLWWRYTHAAYLEDPWPS